MAGRARAGVEEEETGQVTSVGFAGKAEKGCGSHRRAHVEVRWMLRSASSSCPHLGNSCQHISTSVNITKTALGLLISTV